MKFSISVLLASALLCSQAFAWNTVTPGNMEWSNGSSGGTTYTPIGSSTYGSDGSSSYQSGDTTINSNGTSGYRSGNVTTNSDGSRTTVIGDTLYGQRPDGSQFYCRLVANVTVCNPR